MQAASKIHFRILSLQNRADDYRTYRAGLEWDLTDPIVIESSADFKSTPRWHERLTPYHHQINNLITFCRRLPVTLLADDVGLGKTISAGLIMSELIARGRLSKTLIVCPKVLGPQWRQELQNKFDIPGEVVSGRELINANPSGTGVVITTYNSARLYLDRIPDDRFEMLILDEAHKLRNLHGVPDTPQVAKRFLKALSDQRFPFVLMLTATPIQNRLWDLYSLVDLLTAARGHQNPFGSPGVFARRFIDDERDKARQIKPDAKDEFRSIVYGYMSRVRRGDAQLYFPNRIVQMHRVVPTTDELRLIQIIAKPIQILNRLAQISILQALTSSPHALAAQLINMARKGTVPADLANEVGAIVTNMLPSAKLVGLGMLIQRLKQQNQEDWRLVVFTTRRETQTTIQNFLEENGLKVGIINGESGQRNQETIEHFRQIPPYYRVIVSTEAGSEGINLQVANVLVNFDLPWNPMIVEQRIGRVQRLSSAYAHVTIFNIMLQGTFEEFIVGRLMEKLQMASHAIGDIEALLQSSDISDDDEDSGASFEDRILRLVLSALEGKDIEKETMLAVKSIEDAKQELAREEENINAILGGMDRTGYVGPRAPTLSPPERSMDAKTFTLSGLQLLGIRTQEVQPGLFTADRASGREYIVFEEAQSKEQQVTLYAPETPAFKRLIREVVVSAFHLVADADQNPGSRAEQIAHQWAKGFGAKSVAARVGSVTRSFQGEALLRVRATVAHDSYERLVSCRCQDMDHKQVFLVSDGLMPLATTIPDPKIVEIDATQLRIAAESDEEIQEFSRFYLERGAIEMAAAGTDERKRKKLEDDFTPRLEISLVGLEGIMKRDIQVALRYNFPCGGDYESEITVRPSTSEILDQPQTGVCDKTRQIAPQTCLERCVVSGATVLRHLLVSSEFSQRRALPEHMGICAFSGKRALADELEISSITGQQVGKNLLKTSGLTGRRAEPDHFGTCAFTQIDCLKEELAISELSAKPYRNDQKSQSDISGKIGHRSEFAVCHETRLKIAITEAENCEVSDRLVRPGILKVCEQTGKRVLPSLLDTCVATGKHVLKELLVTSSISEAQILRTEAIRASSGRYCHCGETRTCFWSGDRFHPDDLRICSLTGLTIHHDYATEHAPVRLRPLAEILDGIRRNADKEGLWPTLTERLKRALRGGTYNVEAAILSPSKRYLAACSETKTLLGLRVIQVGFIYDLEEATIIGLIAKGRRRSFGWVPQ